MVHKQTTVQRLYRKLLSLYPRAFRERFGESMQQTFDDLYHERQSQTKHGMFGFVLWIFLETAVEIFRERLLIISKGDKMQATLVNLGSSTLVSFLLILPFMIMEVVNRRNFNEDFPLILFGGLWLNLVVLSLILLPIVRGWMAGSIDGANAVSTQRNSLFKEPKTATMISIVLLLFALGLTLFQFRGWKPEEIYVFRLPVSSLFIAFILISFPAMAGIISGGIVANTMRAGGSLLTHPLHLIVVIVISFLFAAGAISLLVDQWPCFIGVPNCD